MSFAHNPYGDGRACARILDVLGRPARTRRSRGRRSGRIAPAVPFETISVVGLGYIGLPTAAVFAGRRLRVVGVDVNAHAVDTINRGEIHITEPDLDIVVRAVVTEGYLRATTTPEPADAFLIAVPTPFLADGSGHEPDLSYVAAASRSIAPVLKAGRPRGARIDLARRHHGADGRLARRAPPRPQLPADPGRGLRHPHRPLPGAGAARPRAAASWCRTTG